MNKDIDELRERLRQFTLLQLPGQPQIMHIGTLQLVNDLWREIERLRAVAEARQLEVLKRELGEE